MKTEFDRQPLVSPPPEHNCYKCGKPAVYEDRYTDKSYCEVHKSNIDLGQPLLEEVVVIITCYISNGYTEGFKHSIKNKLKDYEVLDIKFITTKR